MRPRQLLHALPYLLRPCSRVSLDAPYGTIITLMKAKSLSRSNPYLKNKAKARRLLVRSIASSTAIETGEAINQIEAKLNRPRSAAKRVKLA